MSALIPYTSLLPVPGRSRLFAMISTARSKVYTPHAVRTLLETTPIREEDLIVVINNDDPHPLALPNHPRLEILTHAAPRGFAENGNLMIQRALSEGRDLFLLNNDLIFSRDWLPPLAERDDAIVLPSSNQDTQYAGTIVIPSQGQVSTMIVLSPSLHLDTYLEAPYLFDAIAHTHQQKSEGYLGFINAPFFGVKLPLPVLQSVGAFDTTFGGAGGEDYDYSLRAWMCGFPTLRARRSFLLHFWGRSTWNISTHTEKNTEYDPTYDRSFVEVFRRKWGTPLTELVLNTDLSALAPFPEAREALESLDVLALVKLLGAGGVPTKIT